MTRKEAIKYLRINRKAMTAQMKLALETLVPELREDVEHVCGTCTYWQDGALDRGECQAGEPHQTHSAETCERWERHEEIPLEEQHSEELEEAAENYAEKHGFRVPYDGSEKFYDETDVKASKDGFIAGAEWQKGQMPMPEDTVIFQKGIEEGKRLMMEDAVEGEVVNNGSSGTTIDTKYGVLYLPPLVYAVGDKVKIVIVKEDTDE